MSTTALRRFAPARARAFASAPAASTAPDATTTTTTTTTTSAADAVVIGGGVIGSSIALALARETGRRVRIVEKGAAVGGGSTSYSSGIFRPVRRGAARRSHHTR